MDVDDQKDRVQIRPAFNNLFFAALVVVFVAFGIYAYLTTKNLPGYVNTGEQAVRIDNSPMRMVDSMRMVQKVALLVRRGFETYLLALKNVDEDMAFDALNFFDASVGFAHSPFIDNADLVERGVPVISDVIELIEKNGLTVSDEDLVQIGEKVQRVQTVTAQLEKTMWSNYQSSFIESQKREHVLHLILVFVSLFAVLFSVAFYFSNLRQRKLAQALAQREEQYSLAIRGSNDGLWDWDLKTDVVYYSPRWSEMLGYSPREIEPNLGAWKRLVDPLDEERILAEVQDYLTGKSMSFRTEFRMRHKNGSWVDILARAVASRTDGTPTRLVGTHTDISELKAVEAELTKSRDGLESAVLQRTKELQESKDLAEFHRREAETANRSKSAFLANMSHEIRTPMNGVVGMVDMLMQKNLVPEDKRMVQTIRNSSFSLLRIIDDILDSSKIEAGKLELENTPVQLYLVIEGVTETILPTADAAGVRLTLFIDPAIPGWIYSDAIRLRQILMNLVSNAVKFSRNMDDSKLGQVDILAELSDNGELRLSVTDNGIGMSDEQLDKLFQPFSQAEESTTRKFGGTGLGLMISKSLTEMLGGTITVESALGEGTSFFVTLPFKQAEGSRRFRHVAGWTVLGLISDPLLAARMTKYVEYHGSIVRLAESQDQLMEWLEEHPSQTMAFLMCQTSQNQCDVCTVLTDRFEQTPILSFSAIRSDKFGLVAPNNYVVQRSPALPSELYRGMAILAGLMKPDIDITAFEQSNSSVEPDRSEDRKILLVEDNETNQDVIMMQLEMLGYVAEVAEDGQQGVDLWKSGRFDLILTDCHMPNMDGFEMTDKIRVSEQRNNSPRVPIIAITANALQGEADHCLASGMDAYLSKPVELVRLKKALEDWLPNES